MSKAMPTQAEIERAIRSATKAEFILGAVEIRRDGTIRLVAGNMAPSPARPHIDSEDPDAPQLPDQEKSAVDKYFEDDDEN